MDMIRNFSTPMEGAFSALAEYFSAKIMQQNLYLNGLKFDVPPSTSYSTIELGALLYLKNCQTSDIEQVKQARLTAFCCGLLKEIEICCNADEKLMFAGQLLVGQKFFLTGKGNRLEVATNLGKTQYLKSNLHWQTGDLESLIKTNEGLCISIITNDWSKNVHSSQKISYKGQHGEFINQFKGAITLLAKKLPEYYNWVSTVLKHVAILNPESIGIIESSSSPYTPATIEMSAGTRYQTVGMLIHECSHLYFHLVENTLPIVTSDAPEFYSPLKQCHRSLDRLLLGYHAFGNMLLALEQLKIEATTKEMIELNFECEQIRETLFFLDKPLSKHFNRYLTAAGRALFLPLKRRLMNIHIGFNH
jgi:hypothetical protein